MAFTTNFKTSKVASYLAKYDRKEERRKAKDRIKCEQQAEERRAYQELRTKAYERDGGRCRVSGLPLQLHSDNPYKLAHLHHITYRSAGGPDTLENCIIVSAVVHDKEHTHQIEILGNGNGVVTITEFHKETGRVLRSWESLPVKAVA